MHFFITDFFSDIVENADSSGSRYTDLSIIQEKENITVTATDTGTGMGQEELQKALDPFYTDGVKHPRRKIGLGLPFLIQATGMSGGDFSIASSPGKGTTVTFSFDLSHVDTPPLGSFPQTFRQILSSGGDSELVITRRRGNVSYRVSRSEMLTALEELDSAFSQNLLATYLESLEYEGDSQFTLA